MTRPTSPLTTKKDAAILDEFAELMDDFNSTEDEDYSWVAGKQDEEGDWQ